MGRSTSDYFVSTAYGQMAEVYDRWMGGTDYAGWWRYLSEVFTISPDSRVLEAGCGTGNLTAEISAAGHQLIASDLSPAMLAQAERKLRGRRNVRLLQLDMRELPDSLGRFDVIVAACDAVNYLTRPDQVLRFFTGAAALLAEDGILLFDVHGRGRIANWEVAACHNFVSPDSCYLWRAELCGNRIEHHITGFTKDRVGLWQRFEELHRQRYYDVGELDALLQQAELTMIAAYEFGTAKPCRDESFRVQICARLGRKVDLLVDTRR